MVQIESVLTKVFHDNNFSCKFHTRKILDLYYTSTDNARCLAWVIAMVKLTNGKGHTIHNVAVIGIIPITAFSDFAML